MTFRDEYEARPVSHHVRVHDSDGKLCEEWACRSLGEALRTANFRLFDHMRTYPGHFDPTFVVTAMEGNAVVRTERTRSDNNWLFAHAPVTYR